jgi:hypothetical protein
MSFRISALPKAPFSHLFPMSDDELTAHGAVRQTVTDNPGFPCRISLADAEIGEQIILVHYEHQSAATPFRASHAIYVRPGAEEARPDVGEVPQALRSRMLSLRAFDCAGMLIDADLTDGRELEPAVARLLADPAVAYLHAHFAKPGCYAARIDRV